MELHEMPPHSEFTVGVTYNDVMVRRLDMDDHDAPDAPNPLRAGIRCFSDKKGPATPLWSRPVSFDAGGAADAGAADTVTSRE
jgi:hypothetical protein